MLKQSTLYEFHKAHGAVFTEKQGWLVPLHFGDAGKEYSAVRTQVGLFELPQRAFLSLTGPDRISYLQGLFSNDVAPLTPGQGLYGAFLNQQGKVLSDARVWCLEDSFLIDVWRSFEESILAHLNRYLVADDVEIADLSDEYALLGIAGPKSEFMAARLIGPVGVPRAIFHHAEVSHNQLRVRIARYSHTGRVGFDFILPKTQVAHFAEAITDIGKEYDARWVGEQTLETLRIEAGIPRYGLDVTAETLLLETGMDHAFSFTKGCYLGQEVVERIRSRGHVNKKLTGLLLEGPSEPQTGDKVMLEDKDIGFVTSSTYSPALDRPVAMAYVNQDYWAPGTRVEVKSTQGRLNATVTALPFVQ